MLRLLNKFQFNISFSWQMAVFHLIWAVIILTNLSWNTYLVGWDSLNPEFDIFLNLQRSLFAGWQENYGTGTLGGHGFAATLPHTLAAGVLDLVLPDNLVRQVFTLITMYLGSLGVVVLTKYLITKYFSTLAGSEYSSIIGVIAGLFYIFNLGSTQIFYLPLEAFSVQFAAMPWLYFFLIRFVENRNWKTALHLFIVNFLASTQGFIPSLFIAYVFGLGIFFISLIIFSKEKRQLAITFFYSSILVFLANSYWMGPFAYYVVFRNDIFINSYNNITSTTGFVEKNQLYGTLPQVALLKSFFLEGKYNNEFIFQPWLQWYGIFPITLTAAVFFIIGLFGSLISFGKKQPAAIKALAVTYFFYLTALCTDTFPFSLFTKLLYILSPTLEQAFRTPFTKFGIGLSFFFSIFLALGVFFATRLIIRSFTHYGQKIGQWFIAAVAVAVILVGGPHLTGNSFYKGLKVSIPQSYFQVMEYFKSKPNGRIADLPVDCHEGWYTYSWGYVGSGFYWYGIQQPILSRSFDVWSNETESYYWELTNALRQNDYFLAEEVLKKYDVDWIVWDDNLLHCQSGDGFNYQRAFLDYMQSSTSQFKLAEKFSTPNQGPIQIFERKTGISSGFVGGITNPVSVSTQETYLDKDQALNYVTDYITTGELLDNTVYFPFRNLLSSRNGLSDSIKMEKQGDTKLIISTEMPDSLSGILQTVSYEQLNESVPVELVLVRNGANVDVTINYLFSEIFINDSSVYSYYPTVAAGSFPYEENQKIAINQFEMSNGKGVFNLGKNNTIQVVSPDGSVIFTWNSSTSEAHQVISSEEIRIPIGLGKKHLKVVQHLTPEFDSQSYSLAANFKSVVPRNCEDGSVATAEIAQAKNGAQYLQFENTKNSSCVTIDMTYLDPESSYIIETTTQHLKGNPLTLNITSGEGVFIASTALSAATNPEAQYFVIPPTSSEFAYRMQLKNTSLNKKSSNRLFDVNFLNFPYNMLKDLKVSSLSEIDSKSTDLPYRQLNETQYSVTIPSSSLSETGPTYLVLSQSFDEGWLAFPRLAPWKLLPHTTYNNWANAWEVPGDVDEITILFWPELLVLTGYSFLVVTLFWLWKKSR